MNSNNDAVMEFLLNQLRQQLTNNPYKQQCEDLAHEVLSLKNQLRDASAQLKELHLALVRATGGAEAYKLARKGGHVPEQSGCRKEDTQEHPNCRCATTPVISGPPEQSGCRKEDTQGCEHNWELDNRGDYYVCYKCGKQEAELNDCRHANTVGLRKGFAPGFTKKCLDCGAKLK